MSDASVSAIRLPGIRGHWRGQDFARRVDDNPDTVRNRLVAYHRETAPLIAFYAGEGTLQSLDAMGEIGAITVALRQIIRPIVVDVRNVPAPGAKDNTSQMEEAQ